MGSRITSGMTVGSGYHNSSPTLHRQGSHMARASRSCRTLTRSFYIPGCVLDAESIVTRELRSRPSEDIGFTNPLPSGFSGRRQYSVPGVPVARLMTGPFHPLDQFNAGSKLFKRYGELLKPALFAKVQIGKGDAQQANLSFSGLGLFQQYFSSFSNVFCTV